ncbi:hypothetical protein BN7_6536 [Wickerhamomyces ciferrii]|uniref:Uncharacterized protein n=1 Tax=Wickerhamomyces ciferrii (strain ATCC 14091 / BCRC 22168 / CBS 111 / JCM 3599 / NBRC 0793 / NRRL Y-1031 F-60-10) TaxID=1206466 RepID=K0KNS8_WICCF|nr:uncharacterized protein BN7_6536 [Wickerhamomyces ciferrii]CCH46930.1 hypothetical protein BN7_6536 [Wickerhamomyces ciferrii]
MGNSGSKQARKLPNITRASTNLESNKQQNIKLQQHLQRDHIGLDPNTITQRQKFSANADNKNADKIGQIKIEEIPLTLDENVTLRNRQKREDELSKQRKESVSNTNEIKTNQTVHPSTLVGIIEDIETRSRDELKRTYNINDEFLNILGDQLSIAKTRVKPIEEQPKKDDSLDREKINGISTKRTNDFEDELEKLMSGGNKS